MIFQHKIVPGDADHSNGFYVAQLTGLPRPVIQRASEIMQQMALFPETNPMLDELKELDINTLSPIEALNKLYEWQKKFSD